MSFNRVISINQFYKIGIIVDKAEKGGFRCYIVMKSVFGHNFQYILYNFFQFLNLFSLIFTSSSRHAISPCLLA